MLLFGKELFIRFTVFRELLSVFVCISFPFGFEGMWELLVLVPANCLCFNLVLLCWPDS